MEDDNLDTINSRKRVSNLVLHVHKIFKTYSWSVNAITSPTAAKYSTTLISYIKVQRVPLNNKTIIKCILCCYKESSLINCINGSVKWIMFIGLLKVLTCV